MSFTLALDPPFPSHPHQQPEVFYPGQSLRGTLTYTLPKQRSLNSITLALRAKLETNFVETRGATGGGLAGAGLTHGPRRPMREIIRLFEDSRTLFQGPYDVPSQTFEWKFDFLIPRTVKVDRSGLASGRKGGFKGFIDDGYGDLPPSLDWHDRTVIHDASAKIKYKLVARVESSGLFGNDENEWPIQIRRVSKYPDPVLISVQKEFMAVSWSSQKLRPEGEKFGVRQRMRSIVSSDPGLATPSLNFRASVSMPRCFSANQRFDVDFALVYDRRSDTDPQNPSLWLDSVKLSLRARTKIMVKRGSLVGITISGDRQCEGQYIVAERTARLGNAEKGLRLPLDGTAVKIGDMCIGEWRDGEGVNLLGDFVTWIVKHGYWIAVQAVIRHGETDKMWTLETGFSVQLRDLYVPELADPEDDDVGDGDVLPGYGDDVQPPDHESAEEKNGEGEPSMRDEKR